MVLEKSDDVGGTWRDNTYPGCACDVPSHLYSYSFAPNPQWTHVYSRQPEIWAYLRRTAERLKAAWHELDTGHYPMLSQPEELTRLLLAPVS